MLREVVQPLSRTSRSTRFDGLLVDYAARSEAHA